MPLKFDDKLCPQDHHCPLIEKCPVGAISQHNVEFLPAYDPQKCIKCNLCVESCPRGAVRVVKIS